ncbi:MAG: hypothetical protein WCJ35_28730 [Planctomycetota bacterium]
MATLCLNNLSSPAINRWAILAQPLRATPLRTFTWRSQVRLSGETGEALKKIVESVKATAAKISEIATATVQQAANSEEVSRPCRKAQPKVSRSLGDLRSGGARSGDRPQHKWHHSRSIPLYRGEWPMQT